MVLKLYGHPFSTCTKRVLVVLKETRTPFELEVVDIRNGAHKTLEHMQKQPFAQLPYIDDDGFVLFESRTIARYIAAKAGSPLLPTDARGAALVSQASDGEAFNFNPFAEGITAQRVFNPRWGRECDEARVQDLSATLEGKIGAYERILAKSKYLAGEQVSLADLFHLPYGVYLAQQGFAFLEDEKKFPNVARWWKDITSRPSWQEVKDWNA